MPRDPDRNRTYQREYQRKLREARQCVNCPEPAESGKTRCEKHRLEFNAHVKAKRDAKAAAGLCPLCPDGEPRAVAPGYSVCEQHLSKQHEADARRRAKKKATDGPSPGA